MLPNLGLFLPFVLAEVIFLLLFKNLVMYKPRKAKEKNDSFKYWERRGE